MAFITRAAEARQGVAALRQKHEPWFEEEAVFFTSALTGSIRPGARPHSPPRVTGDARCRPRPHSNYGPTADTGGLMQITR